MQLQLQLTLTGELEKQSDVVAGSQPELAERIKAGLIRGIERRDPYFFFRDFLLFFTWAIKRRLRWT